MVSGEEAEAIHRENIAILSSMNANEILQAREEFLGSLKPESIEFLKKRRMKGSTCDMESSFRNLSTNEPT